MRREGSHDEPDDDSSHTRLYTLLRLRPTCSADDVQRSFRLLSRVFHPDKAAALSSSAAAPFTTDISSCVRGADDDTFVELQMCSEVLTDRVLRRGYDIGGATAVRLLQRSQRHHPSNAGEENPLYAAMERASSDEEAVFLLHRALEEFQRQEERWGQPTEGAAGMTQIDSSLMSPIADFEQETSAASVSVKTPITAQSAIMTSVSHSLQPTGVGTMSVGVGFEQLAGTPSKLHPSGSSTYAVDARFRSRRRKDKPDLFLLPLPDLALRTRRQFASGNVIAVDLFGNLVKKMTWTYSISSFRNLKWNSGGSSDHPCSELDESSLVTLQALWRCRIQAATGRLGSLVVQLRTTEREEAQYRLRLSLINPNSVKFAYRSSSYSGPDGGLAVSWTVGFWDVWNKVKVTWCQRIGGGRVTCQYGVKYDGRTLLLLLLPSVETRRFDTLSQWTLVAYVYSNETSIRIPLSLSSRSPALPVCVAGMLSVLSAKWIEPILEDLRGGDERDDQMEWASMATIVDQTSVSVSEVLLHAMPAGMREVAHRKRDAEAKGNGLVLLFVSLDGTHDSTLNDFLQFWVVGSSLHLPRAEIWNRTQTRRPSNGCRSPTWNDWLGRSAVAGTRANAPISNTCECSPVRMTVRYSYGGWVYESTFCDSDWIVLPNMGMKGTTRLGRCTQVN